MKHDVVDAFVSPTGGGNAAGVVLCAGAFFEEAEMLAKAAELGFSETVFMLRQEEDWHFRYFTPVEEVPLCGHATIAAIHYLGEKGLVRHGSEFSILTGAGRLSAELEADGLVWMEMASPQCLASFSREESVKFYRPFEGAMPAGEAEIITTGLPDMILPIATREELNALRPDMEAITQISRETEACGYHLYTPGEGEITAYTRNFAPLLGIPEEAATGTASGALSYYLYRKGLVSSGQPLCFKQGEAMGLTSLVYARVTEDQDGIRIMVGGRAKVR